MHLEVEEKKGPAAKMAMLRKLGLVEYAIDYATETADFEHAFSLAKAAGLTTKLADIHLKHAMHLEVISCRQCRLPPLHPRRMWRACQSDGGMRMCRTSECCGTAL